MPAMRVGGAIAHAPIERVRPWQSVAQDGTKSQHCYPSARAAALAAYWDNVTAADCDAYAGYNSEEAIELARTHGFTVEQEPA